MIARFNLISAWIIEAILEAEDLKSRVKTFTKVVAIAKCLLELNNLSTLMAMIAGWNNSAISRLKFTRKELPKKAQEDVAMLENLMSAEGSYKNYRGYIHKVNPPEIPYIGVYLSDLTFIEDGNPNMVGNLINFEKRRLLCSVILELQTYQQKPYNLQVVAPLYELLAHLPNPPDEAKLYATSLVREPRNATRDMIK